MGINEDLSAFERRGTRRRHINMSARIRGTDGSEHGGAIRNICETGCLFQCDSGAQLVPGRHYSLLIEGLEMQVVCAAWSKDGEAGFELAEPLDPAVVEHLVRSALLALAANVRRDRERLEDLPRRRGRGGGIF